MLSNINERDWGGKINPSARKSIHAGCSTCIENKNMGRYGCSHRKEQQVNAGQSQGTDEVDNVMSKLAHPYNSSRPLPTRKRVSRRNSIDVPGANDSDETDEDVLSKSSPATFFLSYSSDNELYRSATKSNFNTSRDELQTSTNNSPTQDRDTHQTRSSPKNGSYTSGNTLESCNISPAHNISRRDIIGDYETRYGTRSSQNGYMSGVILESARINSAHNLNTRHNINDYETTRGESKFKYYVGLILVMLAAVTIGVHSHYFSQTVDTKNYIFSNDVIFYDHLSSLGAKYKVTRDALLRLKIGLTTISKNQDAASFMLIYDSKSESFNAKVLFSFVEELALKTVQYLRNHSNSIQNVIVDTDQIETESELRALQSEVEKTGVMIVPNINNVPSELAMAFHYYCDEYNPLVKSSAIFFTLDAAACLHGKQVTHTFIENCLLNKWNNIHKDKIGPLLTRVVNVIIDITNITLL